MGQGQGRREENAVRRDRAELGTMLVNEVLTDYLREKAEGVAKTLTLGGQILSKWVAAKAELKKTNRAQGSLFNPLQSIYIGETTHSALVGNLLNPQGSHGQASLFLESFLALLGVPEPSKGKWVVTVENGRIDILLRRLKPSSVIIIENKSNYAGDKKNQLYRYWHRKICVPYPNLDYTSEFTKRSFKIVYLAPDSSKNPVNDSLERPLEWAKMNLPKRIPIEPKHLTIQELIKHWLADPDVRISETNVRLTTFLHFYSELW
jgi:hypothetical protein